MHRQDRLSRYVSHLPNDDTGHQEGDNRADSKPTEDKQTKRYQAEEANCRRQERGNLEMGQYATPSDLVAEDFDGNPILVYQLDRRARIASAALDDYDKSSSKFNGMSGWWVSRIQPEPARYRGDGGGRDG